MMYNHHRGCKKVELFITPVPNNKVYFKDNSSSWIPNISQASVLQCSFVNWQNLEMPWQMMACFFLVLLLFLCDALSCRCEWKCHIRSRETEKWCVCNEWWKTLLIRKCTERIFFLCFDKHLKNSMMTRSLTVVEMEWWRKLGRFPTAYHFR